MKVGDLVHGKFRKLKPLAGIIVGEQQGYFGGYETDPVLVYWFKSGKQCWMRREALKLVSEV